MFVVLNCFVIKKYVFKITQLLKFLSTHQSLRFEVHACLRKSPRFQMMKILL